MDWLNSVPSTNLAIAGIVLITVGCLAVTGIVHVDLSNAVSTAIAGLVGFIGGVAVTKVENKALGA